MLTASPQTTCPTQALPVAEAAWCAANPPKAIVHLHPVDVGPTKEWGMPRTDKAIRRFPDHQLSVWDCPDCVQPVTLDFDNDMGRAPYHRMERYVTPAEIRGRMARFDITPQPIPPRDLPLILATYLMKM